MRFSLANLLLMVAVVAVAIGWWCDRARLQNANGRLNAEAAALMSEARTTTTHTALEFPSGKLPPSRVYDFLVPEDRAAYRQTYGQIGQPGVLAVDGN
jgi:hypothetical protein